MLESTRKLLNIYRINGQSERLGQFFVNRYIRNPWPDLFYQVDQGAAIRMIEEWLTTHQYTVKLPLPIRPLSTTPTKPL